MGKESLQLLGIGSQSEGYRVATKYITSGR